MALSLRIENAINRRARLSPQLMRLFYPWADRIVAVSNGVADGLVRLAGIPREDVRTGPSTIQSWGPSCVKGHRLLWTIHGSGPDSPRCCWRQAANRAKGFLHLDKAFANVRQTQPTRLLIMGEGRERRPALEALVGQLSQEQGVSMPGFEANPYAYMARASVFVLSSRWEGLPGVLIEALSCGAPLIATDCPSGPRKILKEGRYGYLVPIGNIEAMAEGIEKALAGKILRPPREKLATH